jgi:hypothetical protein
VRGERNALRDARGRRVTTADGTPSVQFLADEKRHTTRRRSSAGKALAKVGSILLDASYFRNLLHRGDR